jgi:hypothetical protein
MEIAMCDNNEGEVDDPSVWDDHLKYKDIGWGYRREGEPECYSPEDIKEFLETFEPHI